MIPFSANFSSIIYFLNCLSPENYPSLCIFYLRNVDVVLVHVFVYVSRCIDTLRMLLFCRRATRTRSLRPPHRLSYKSGQCTFLNFITIQNYFCEIPGNDLAISEHYIDSMNQPSQRDKQQEMRWKMPITPVGPNSYISVHCHSQFKHLVSADKTWVLFPCYLQPYSYVDHPV